MRSLVPLFAVAALAGCSPALIPNTQVEDTEQNREVIEFCEDYRLALEAQDYAKLVSLVSNDYWEDSASPPGNDDYDLEGLQQVIRSRFPPVASIRYDIRYRRITWFDDRVEVYYSFYGRYQVNPLDGEGEPLWFSKVGDNRLVLVRSPNGWRIASGL